MPQAAEDGLLVEASIIIPAFEHVDYTIAAVISLLEHASSTRYESIIGNNVSSDETADVFTAVGGVLRCITHQANEGFIRNCNLSARHASGDYIVLLNNDTLILDGWLDELLAPFRRFAGVGLTGSQLIHHEGITHGTDVTTSTKAYQAINRDKFVAKWQSTLAAGQYPNAEHVFLARDRSGQRKHILVIDHYIPQPDRDAGSRTMFSYVKMFVDAGLQVAFWPENLYRDRACPASAPMRQIG